MIVGLTNEAAVFSSAKSVAGSAMIGLADFSTDLVLLEELLAHLRVADAVREALVVDVVFTTWQ